MKVEKFVSSKNDSVEFSSDEAAMLFDLLWDEADINKIEEIFDSARLLSDVDIANEDISKEEEILMVIAEWLVKNSNKVVPLLSKFETMKS